MNDKAWAPMGTRAFCLIPMVGIYGKYPDGQYLLPVLHGAPLPVIRPILTCSLPFQIRIA